MALPIGWLLANGNFIGTDANLSNGEVSGVDLIGIDLSSSKLTGVQSNGVTSALVALPTGWVLLNGFRLGPTASLYNADLSGADLAGLDLTFARLGSANLSATNLAGTDFTGATFQSVRSGSITGTPAELPDSWHLVDGYVVGPSTNLTDADLTGANVTDIDLTSVQ